MHRTFNRSFLFSRLMQPLFSSLTLKSRQAYRVSIIAVCRSCPVERMSSTNLADRRFFNTDPMNIFFPQRFSCQSFSGAIKRTVNISFPLTANRVPRSITRCRPISTAVGQVINLPDGRSLGYHEFGDPTGTPVLYIHGTPDSGVTLSGFEHPLAKQLGVRWIAPDRPGIGNSTFHSHRRVLDYPADLRALIQHLGLPYYRIIGTSGGTGFTLACAQALPREELLAVGICAGFGPWEAGSGRSK